jgi:cysteine synthase A
LNHFENKACALAHRDYTGVEIWQDTDGKVDVLVAGVGTGATITGVGKLLKSKNPSIEVIAVEPTESAVLSGRRPGKHNIPGLGAGFIPPLLDTSLIDRIITVSGEEAAKTVGKLRTGHGTAVSVCSAAVYAAAEKLLDEREYSGKMVVAILPS